MKGNIENRLAFNTRREVAACVRMAGDAGGADDPHPSTADTHCKQDDVAASTEYVDRSTKLARTNANMASFHAPVARDRTNAPEPPLCWLLEKLMTLALHVVPVPVVPIVPTDSNEFTDNASPLASS